MPESDDIEEIARLLYEAMVKRVQRRPVLLLHGWEMQPEDLREDWRALALKARELARP